ncbi:dedicator of cytokinesis protein 7-like isoform X5 [Lineus longissimus]|uniref:dedicator of cytokinesis protein 7-like isoform X5 n=1 Tax=Lineus longissimus TaxID=88925 RepID=UPI00315DB2D3
MASDQRAFAKKLNKQGAAEVRRQISSAYLKDGSFKDGSFNKHEKDIPKSISGISLSSALSLAVPINEVVKPIDYEDFVVQHQTSIEKDSMRELLEFPPNDVEVKLLPKQCRTIAPIIPEHGYEADAHVRDCIQCYTSDYTIVNRRYQIYSSSYGGKDRQDEKNAVLKSIPRQEFEIDHDDILEKDPEKNGEETSCNGRKSINMNDTPRSSWASSIFDLKNSQADPLLPNLLERIIPEEIDTANAEERMKDRQDALLCLFPLQEEEEMIEKRPLADIPAEHFGHRVLVKCLQVKFDLEIEPIFASMAVYDAKERKKVSENFYFDLNPEYLKKMLDTHVPYQDVSTLSRSCVFSITYPSPDLFLVVRYEKVLQQGDISECAEPYMKDEKNKEKIRANAAYFCDKLGKYRMPFAWTAIHLLNVITGTTSMEREASTDRTEAGSTNSLDRRSSLIEKQLENFRKRSKVPGDENLSRRGSFDRARNGEKRRSWSPDENTNPLENFRPVTITVSSFFKQENEKLSDDDLYKFLADLKRPMSVQKKLKCIPGTLKLDISLCPDEPKYCLSPELYKIDPYPDDKGRPTKEIVEFPSREVYMPWTTYRNILYIYPKYLNFGNRQGSARNLAVKVQFLAGEEDKSALPVIFGKSGCPELTKEAYSAVTYHNKTPDFYEEVKIKLPGRLCSSHHLLFTFYHISCQKKMEQTPIELPVGYTWLQIMKDNRLAVGEFNLPVLQEKPPSNYSVLHPDVELPGMKWVDGHKPVFTVDIQAVSSIHTQDEHLDCFLNYCHMAEEFKVPPRIGPDQFEHEFKRHINDIVNAKGEPLVKFLSLIFEKLILLMVRPPVVAGQVLNVAQTCFESIAQIVRRITNLLDEKNDQHGRNSLLTTYIHYSCALPSPDSEMSPQEIFSHALDCSGPEVMSLRIKSSTALSPSSTSPVALNQYATLGRPVTLPMQNKIYQRSNSDTDLNNTSNPTTPENEHGGFFGGKTGSPQNSRYDSAVPYYQKMKKVSERVMSKCSDRLVHEEIALLWVMSNGTQRQLSLENAWFFFEIMTKSMAEHLDRYHKLDAPRKSRFSQRFIEDITGLIGMITKDIVDRYLKDPLFIRNLNTALAFFLHDMLSLMDRGYVFQLIKDYCKIVSAKVTTLGDATTLELLKLDFLRIVCSHEHYVTLNLPIASIAASAPSSPTPSIASTTSQQSYTSTATTFIQQDRSVFTELSTEFRHQHFLVGLILCDLAASFESHNNTVHNKAINVIRNLLTSHDMDPRYSDPEVKARVAMLYLPLINIVIDALPQLYDPNQEGKPRSGPSSFFDDERGIDRDVAMAIAGAPVSGTGGVPSMPSSSHGAGDVSPDYDYQKRRTVLTAEGTRSLLMCFQWVLKNIDTQFLRHWWSDMPLTKLNQILEVLYLTIYNFEYKGKMNFHALPPVPLPRQHSVEEVLTPTKRSFSLRRSSSYASLHGDDPGQAKKAIKQCSAQTIKKSSDMKSKLEEAILGFGSARSEMMMRRNKSQTQFYAMATPPSPVTDLNRLRWRKEQTAWKQQSDHPDRQKSEMEIDAHVEGNLATEVAMVCIDTIDLIIQIVQGSDSLQAVLSSVLRVLLHSMALNQSSAVLQHMFAVERSLVSKFPELLFEEETEQCADLCLQLLKHCSSCIGNTRSHASASLYLLMRQNFEIGNNFARVKMQVTMALSRLVGKSQSFNEEYLRKSLKTILTYAEADCELQETTFPEQVRDLIFNLHMILSDTVKMKEFQEDPEMLIDLMYRIAKGYQNSPDLRLTWLQNMAGKHSERSNHAEAAQCLIHAAGLVGEYLNMLEDKPHLPVGCVSFQNISSNVLEESAVSDDVVSPDGEGICTGKYFTESGMIGLLEQAASSFNMAGMYESLNEVYKVLLPIHEANRDYKRLAIIHGKLQEAFNNVIRQEGKRMFGTYFRVGFYGEKFGDLDAQEFIYKEPSITKLPEISHRLENFYSERFGEENLKMIKDSNTVERDKQEAGKAYIQITYVEPYFDAYERLQRHTYFHMNYNIKSFMYATPFTLDGRAHGELREQYKRKTILTTAQAFPYIRTRLPVISREQIILSPIEVAIEDVQKKTREMNIALTQDPIDPKILQMVLQGCIGTTVNQGPVEIAAVFLAELAEGRVPANRHHNKLRICFKDFLRKCSIALQRNKEMIGSNQREYQRELERNYNSVKEKLQPMIASSVAMQTLKRGKHCHRSISAAFEAAEKEKLCTAIRDKQAADEAEKLNDNAKCLNALGADSNLPPIDADGQSK